MSLMRHDKLYTTLHLLGAPPPPPRGPLHSLVLYLVLYLVLSLLPYGGVSGLRSSVRCQRDTIDSSRRARVTNGIGCDTSEHSFLRSFGYACRLRFSHNTSSALPLALPPWLLPLPRSCSALPCCSPWPLPWWLGWIHCAAATRRVTFTISKIISKSSDLSPIHLD